MATKTRKKIARKKIVRKSPATAASKAKVSKDNPRVGAPKAAGSVEIIGKGRKTSIYQPVLDQMKALKPGDGFEVFPFAGQSVKQLAASLGSVFLRQAPTPPKGYRWAKATLKNQTGVFVYLSKDA